MSNFENNEMFYTICVPKKSEKGFYRIQTTWIENEVSLSLIVLDSDRSFTSNITRSDFKKQAEILEIPLSEYIEKVLLSLKNEANDTIFYYERKNYEFLIYRQQNLTSMKIILMKFELTEVNFSETVENFIDKIRAENNFYKEKLEISENEKIILTKEKVDALQKLENFINKKEKWENEIYTKFILLLNEKKKKIAKLLDLVKVKNLDVEQIQTTIQETKSKTITRSPPPKTIPENRKKKKLEVLSSSGSEDENHDDDIFDVPTQKNIDTSQFEESPDLLMNLSVPPKQCTQHRKEKMEKNDSQDLEDLFSANEVIMNSMNMEVGKSVSPQNKESPQKTESLNFCTQDLLDRF